MRFRVVNTDNFGGDYPDESFVGGIFETCAEAKAFADETNDKWGDYSPRFLKVVTEGYVLQPGFEP